MRPYIFYPKTYYHYSGGVRAMHYLCHHLNNAGQEAYITAYPTNPSLNTPYIDERTARILLEQKRGIAVYPERVNGNPYQAETVVRLLLHAKGYFTSDVEFSDNEITYGYTNMVYAGDILHIPCIEDFVVNTPSNYKTRFGSGYLVGKGTNNNTHPSGAHELNLTDFPTREALIDFLDRAEFVYLYDDYTLLVWEARLRGCPVVFADNVTRTRELYEKSEYGTDGLAWGFEELQHALETLNSIKVQYHSMVDNFHSKVLQAFIERTQND